MVTVSKQLIVAQPNCSASWRHNQCLLLAMGVWSILVGLAFGLRGAWLILPIMLIELSIMAMTLYLVCKKIQQRHILRFKQHQLRVEKDPLHNWQLSLQQTRLSVERQAHPWSPLKIFLCTPQQSIAIGDFLSREDSQILLDELRLKGLRICNDSEAGLFNA